MTIDYGAKMIEEDLKAAERRKARQSTPVRLEPLQNPCIKTGAAVVAAGMVFYGDLFDFGERWMLNCPKPGWLIDYEDGKANAAFETWEAEHQKGCVVVFRKSDLRWFDYDGRTGAGGF